MSFIKAPALAAHALAVRGRRAIGAIGAPPWMKNPIMLLYNLLKVTLHNSAVPTLLFIYFFPLLLPLRPPAAFNAYCAKLAPLNHGGPPDPLFPDGTPESPACVSGVGARGPSQPAETPLHHPGEERRGKRARGVMRATAIGNNLWR